ncbi:MAG TPA: hypothetical protein VNO30_26480 [Kofleriaceae bacterium]|nr:hypothetical protein [Kofleriaceae bacterium]
MIVYMVSPWPGAVRVGRGQLEVTAPVEALAKLYSRMAEAGNIGEVVHRAMVEELSTDPELAARVSEMEQPLLAYTTGTPISVGGGHRWLVPFTAYLVDRARLAIGKP